jgi:hypothetical protein
MGKTVNGCRAIQFFIPLKIPGMHNLNRLSISHCDKRCVQSLLFLNGSLLKIDSFLIDNPTWLEMKLEKRKSPLTKSDINDFGLG